MGKDNVAGFFAAWQRQDGLAGRLAADPTPENVIACARELGYVFSESDPASALKELVYGARGLPRGWGWPLARNLGPTRKP